MIIRRFVESQFNEMASKMQFSLSDYGLSGTVASVTFQIVGVVEDNTNTGGSDFAAGVKLNSSPNVARAALYLKHITAGNTYYLNHAATETEGCVKWDVSFTLTDVDSNSVFEFGLTAANDNKQEEPRDATTEAWLNVNPSGAADDAAQYASLALSFPAANSNMVRAFEFSGFVDNVRLGGER